MFLLLSRLFCLFQLQATSNTVPVICFQKMLKLDPDPQEINANLQPCLSLGILIGPCFAISVLIGHCPFPSNFCWSLAFPSNSYWSLALPSNSYWSLAFPSHSYWSLHCNPSFDGSLPCPLDFSLVATCPIGSTRMFCCRLRTGDYLKRISASCDRKEEEERTALLSFQQNDASLFPYTVLYRIY